MASSWGTFGWRVDVWCLGVQAKRISGSDALSHPYLDEGRLRYHTCMCQCCYSVPSGRVYTRDFEPVAERPFSHSYENSLLSVWQGKGTAQRLPRPRPSRDLCR